MSQVTAAKAYRLLRAVLNTAVADRIILRNPCQIPGAGVERSPERPVATVQQVCGIADSVPPRYRLLVLLACFASLRWGELAALARRHVDLEAGTLFVERGVVELPNGSLVFGPPKSEAGKRVVTVPAALVPELRLHLEEFTGSSKDSLIFTTPRGLTLRRSNFTRHWSPAIAAAGIPGLHFHDLRHTGNTWASETGATLRELMERMGHSSSRAALIYLHTRPGRDKAIADGLSALIEGAGREREDDDPDVGGAGTLVPTG